MLAVKSQKVHKRKRNNRSVLQRELSKCKIPKNLPAIRLENSNKQFISLPVSSVFKNLFLE